MYRRCSGRAARRGLLAVTAGSVLLCSLGLATPAAARGTAAGTTFANVATVTYTESGTPIVVTSNTVTIRVQEILGVTVQATGNRIAVEPNDTQRVLPFTITNIGNGPERYTLATRTALTDDNFDPTCSRIVLDTNGNGLFDPTADTTYVAGANEPELLPDASIAVFAICDIPGSAANEQIGNVALDSAAVTGSGTPGTLFAGKGVAGIDAIVGLSTARGSATNGFIVQVDFPTLAKTQRVTDPQGGTTPIAGATIAYTLVADLRSGAVTSAVIRDPIPSGTSYEAGSLRLDDSALSDVADGDAGRFTGTGIEVVLGNLAAAAPRIISFKVRINP